MCVGFFSLYLFSLGPLSSKRFGIEVSTANWLNERKEESKENCKQEMDTENHFKIINGCS